MKFRLNAMLALFATVAILVLARPVRAQYIGDAYGLNLNLVGLGLLTAGDTGALPSSGGGPFTEHLLSASLGSATLGLGATTGVIDTSTQGIGGVVNSSATVNGLNVIPPLLSSIQLSATTITSQATANSGGTSGSSTITNLVFGNVAINVTGAANQTVVDALGNTLIINQQIHNANGSLTVNALDLQLLGSVVSLKVSSSTAGYTGLASTPEPGSMALLTGALITGGVFTVRRRRKSMRK